MEEAYFSQLFTDDITEGMFIFGEVIADSGSFDRDLGPYLSTTSMDFMDFPLQATIRQAFGFGGSLRSLENPVFSKGALAGDRAITFTVNHDIPNNDGFRFMILDPVDEDLAYTYILGRADGAPHIYSDLGIEDGLREDRWKMAHRDQELWPKIHFRNLVNGTGQETLFINDCIYAFRRGDRALVGINKCGEPFQINVDLGLTSGSYINMLNQNQISVASGNQTISIGARSSVMYINQSLLQ